MEIQERVVQGVVFIRPVTDRLDVRIAADLRSKLQEHISNGSRNIALNLTDVDFMDSTGLGVLITTLRLLECKGELALCGVRSGVLGLLKITSMTRVVTVYESEEAVIQAFVNRVI